MEGAAALPTAITAGIMSAWRSALRLGHGVGGQLFERYVIQFAALYADIRHRGEAHRRSSELRYAIAALWRSLVVAVAFCTSQDATRPPTATDEIHARAYCSKPQSGHGRSSTRRSLHLIMMESVPCERTITLCIRDG